MNDAQLHDNWDLKDYGDDNLQIVFGRNGEPHFAETGQSEVDWCGTGGSGECAIDILHLVDDDGNTMSCSVRRITQPK